MSLNLPKPSTEYDPNDEARTRSLIAQDALTNQKSTDDVVIVRRLLILQSPNGDRWEVTVSNVGLLGTTAL